MGGQELDFTYGSSRYRPDVLVVSNKTVCLCRASVICCFVFLLLAFGGGCGKKETPAPAPSADNTQTQPVATASQPPQQPAAAAQQPSSAAAAPANSPRPETYDAAVTARTIDALRGLIARKDWSYARQTLSQLEKRPLTPEQRQYVDTLKAQIPK